MEIYTVKNLTFKYPQTAKNVLNDISFSINSGEFITLCGPSGCGKSTLLRHLKPALKPNGIFSGKVLFEDNDINNLSLREQSQKIGFVLQNPDNQIVTDKVWHELAFGLENLGYDNSIIRKRVAETASFFGIQHWFDKNVTELSGGQKQLLNLASIMAMQPKVLILDEPTSQLDPIAASEFISCLTKINKELGVTVIITEHRLDDILPQSSRVLVMENGTIASYGTPQHICCELKDNNSHMFSSMSAQMQIWSAVTDSETNCPVTVCEGRKWLEHYCDDHKLTELYSEEIPVYSDKTAIELKDVWFRYEKTSPDILKGISLKINEGEFAAILGGNGTGKTTALSVINGTNKPYRGKVNIFSDNLSQHENSGVITATLPQNPQTLFLRKTVREDLYEVFDGKKIDNDTKNKMISSVISLCRLEDLINRHPFDLSGGEQQRAALAKILLLRPRILLLDEPTKGLDSELKNEFAQIIHTLNNSGVTVLMVSHDIEFCAKYTHRCMLFFNGEVISQGTPREFFASNSFYVTSANRMSRGLIKDAVTADDVIYCCTGIKPENGILNNKSDLFDLKCDTIENSVKKKSNKTPLYKKVLGAVGIALLIAGIIINLDYFSGFSSKSFPQWFNYAVIGIPIIILMIAFGAKTKKSSDESTQNQRLSKRTIAMIICVLLAIPLTIFVGMTYLGDQKYLFISLLILFEAMIPFFLVFEGKKPKARELVIIAVLCALAVSGRVIFNLLPQINPVIALVIISGISFGGETGFLVGSVTMLVSNIMLGQGPWTPWQMFSAGIIGFLAGILSKCGLLSRQRTSLCIFGFFVTLVLYGGIMNFYSAVSSHSALNFEMLAGFYIQGFPMDIIHALSSVIFLYFAAEPMLEKLDRIKTKYGLLA